LLGCQSFRENSFTKTTTTIFLPQVFWKIRLPFSRWPHSVPRSSRAELYPTLLPGSGPSPLSNFHQHFMNSFFHMKVLFQAWYQCSLAVLNLILPNVGNFLNMSSGITC